MKRVQRRLIVNADDFGLSSGVNRGVIAAYERGIVTSASLMVRWPAAREAAAYASLNRELSLGLHFDFGEWVYRDACWQLKYRVLGDETRDSVTQEAYRQLQTFIDLAGRTPSHLDSHQHAHRDEPLRSVLEALSRQLVAPLREYSSIRYSGDFYGQSDKGQPLPEFISSAALQMLLGELPEGTTELGCHPGLDAGLDSVYRDERFIEVQTLCDPAVSRVIRDEGIVLCSFRDAFATAGA